MKTVLMILALLSILTAEEWKLVKDRDGVSVYTSAVEGSEYLAFKGETVVEGSVAALVSVMYDTPVASEWLYQCSFAMTLEEKSFEKNYIFQRYDLPFPVSNRQVILQSTLFWTADGARLETKEASSYCDDHQTDRCAKVNESTLIKFTRSRGHYLFTPINEHQTKVIWQQHTEPGGKIPAWLVNALVVDIPFNSLQRLGTLVEDAKYRNMTKNELQARWLQQYQAHH